MLMNCGLRGFLCYREEGRMQALYKRNELRLFL